MEFPGIADLLEKAKSVKEDYTNFIAATVNDHVIRVAVMTQPFFWHRHPNSDECFFVVDGELLIDLDDTTIELQPGQMYTVQKNVWHRTRPGKERSVNLTFESSDMETIKRD